MPHSPLGMPDHSAMLAAAQMNALNSSALSGMLNAARPPFSTSQGMPFGMGNPLGGKSSPIGRGTPSSDGGSGSAGNGPTIQVIDVKLEEVRYSKTNCSVDSLDKIMKGHVSYPKEIPSFKVLEFSVFVIHK